MTVTRRKLSLLAFQAPRATGESAESKTIRGKTRWYRKKYTCAESKPYLIVLEKALQLALKYATARSQLLQCNAEADLTWEQVSFFPLLQVEMRKLRAAWSWANLDVAVQCKRPAQSWRPWVHPGWDGSHCTGSQPSLHPCSSTAWQRHCTVGNSKAKAKSFKQHVGNQVLKAFVQVGLQSTGVLLSLTSSAGCKKHVRLRRNLCHRLSLACVYGEEPPSLIRKSPDGSPTGKAFLGNHCSLHYFVSGHFISVL